MAIGRGPEEVAFPRGVSQVPKKDDIGTLIWTEEITDSGIATTCGDSCQCWLIIDDCELIDI